VIKALALALEELKSEFLLQELELFTDAGLGCVQSIGSRSDIETVVDDSEQIFELL
jgi:hypothetical protein